MALPASLSAIPETLKDGDTAGIDGTAGSTTIGLLAGRINLLADSINAAEEVLANTLSGRVFNVELPPYNAVPDDMYLDGVSTASNATFTSATANFTSADIGKNIMIFRAGPSSGQDHHTTIASINSTTSVQLTHTAGRSQTPARFYLSRGGSQQTKFTSAITDADAANGGLIFAPGVGYHVDGLILKRRTSIAGIGGKRATCLHIGTGANKPVIKNDNTLNNSADFVGVWDLYLDGNRLRQTDWTWNQDTTFTANSSTTITITGAQAPQPSGSMKLANGNRVHYTSYTAVDADTWTLNGVLGGCEGTTDTTQASGVTITQHQCHGIYFQQNPYVSMPEGVGPGAEEFDPRHVVKNVAIKNVRGNGAEHWGQSEVHWIDVTVWYADHFGFRPSHDSVFTTCVAGLTGRAGFYIRSTKIIATGSSAWYNGGNVAAEGWGFFFEGPSTLETGGKIFTACAAQDCKAEGVYVRNAQRVRFDGVIDSCGYGGSAGQYAAMKLDGATNGIFDVVCVERMYDGVNAKQQHALHILSTSFKTQQNSITISHAGAQGVGVGRAIKPGSDMTGFNDIIINGARLSPWKAPVRAASTANLAPTTNPDTTLSTTATTPTQTLTVASGTGIRIGDRLLLNPATTAEEVTVTAVAGTTITLGAPTLNTHASASTVRNISALLIGGTTLTVDAVALANYDRVFLKDQTAGWQNGLYYPTGIGTAVVLNRAQDGSEDFHFNQGLIVPISEGTANGDSIWQMTTTYPIVYGNTSITFVRVSPKKYRSLFGFSVRSPVASSTIPATGLFWSKDSAQTSTAVKVRYEVIGGTNVTFKVQKNGSDWTGFGTTAAPLTATTTATETTSSQTLVDNDDIDVMILGVSGAVDLVKITLVVENSM